MASKKPSTITPATLDQLFMIAAAAPALEQAEALLAKEKRHSRSKLSGQLNKLQQDAGVGIDAEMNGGEPQITGPASAALVRAYEPVSVERFMLLERIHGLLPPSTIRKDIAELIKGLKDATPEDAPSLRKLTGAESRQRAQEKQLGRAEHVMRVMLGTFDNAAQKCRNPEARKEFKRMAVAFKKVAEQVNDPRPNTLDSKKSLLAELNRVTEPLSKIYKIAATTRDSEVADIYDDVSRAVGMMGSNTRQAIAVLRKDALRPKA